MAAEIHQLPRFKGEKPRKLPAGKVEIHEALEILAGRSAEWRDFIDNELQHGESLISAETRADHRVVDGASLQAMGEDLAQIAMHLNNLAKLLRDDEGDDA